jgi:hypothetical protein
MVVVSAVGELRMNGPFWAFTWAVLRHADDVVSLDGSLVALVVGTTGAGVWQRRTCAALLPCLTSTTGPPPRGACGTLHFSELRIGGRPGWSLTAPLLISTLPSLWGVVAMPTAIPLSRPMLIAGPLAPHPVSAAMRAGDSGLEPRALELLRSMSAS